MDRLVDHLFVFEGEGQIRDFPGNYTQYREWQKQQEAVPEEARKEVPVQKVEPVAVTLPATKKKLSFKEQKEFELLEKEIKKLEQERDELTAQLSDASLQFEDVKKASERILQINDTIDEKEMRWLELSESI
jgi:ATP-binding cassette subfamily F protein uup